MFRVSPSVLYRRLFLSTSTPPILFQTEDGSLKYGVVGGGGGVVPVCGEVAGTGGRQSQPTAAGVPQTIFAPSRAWVEAGRNGLLANRVFGRLAEGLTTQLIQF